MVGHRRRGLRGLDGAPHHRVGRTPGPAARGRGPPAGVPDTAVPGGEAVGQTVRVEHLGLDDLRQRHLPDQDFLAAVGVEGPGLGEFVLVGRRQGQAVAVGEHPSRVVVHVATPGSRRSIPFVRRAVPAAYGPQPLTIRAGGNPQ